MVLLTLFVTHSYISYLHLLWLDGAVIILNYTKLKTEGCPAHKCYGYRPIPKTFSGHGYKNTHLCVGIASILQLKCKIKCVYRWICYFLLYNDFAHILSNLLQAVILQNVQQHLSIPSQVLHGNSLNIPEHLHPREQHHGRIVPHNWQRRPHRVP